MNESKYKEENLQLKNDILDKEKAYNLKIKERNDLIFQLREEIFSLEGQLKTKIETLTTVLNQKSNLESELNKLINKYSDLEKKYNGISYDMNVLVENHKKLNQENNLLESTNESLHLECEKYFNLSKEKEETIQKLKIQNNKLIDEIQNIYMRDENIANKLNNKQNLINAINDSKVICDKILNDIK